MSELIGLLICLLIFIAFILTIRKCRDGLISIRQWSSFTSILGRDAHDKHPICVTGGRCYPVVKTMERQKTAATLLDSINDFCTEFLRHLREKYVFNKLGNTRQTQVVERLLRNFNPDTLVENNPIDLVNTSFVDDKGVVFALCLRKKTESDNVFHSIDELKFVAMHEITHMATLANDHPPEFWENFKFLLKEAAESGLYTPVDYAKYPVTYCTGLEVTYNPYFCENTANI